MFEKIGLILLVGCILLVVIVVLLEISTKTREWVLYDKAERQTRQSLQLLIDRANSGNEGARLACDNNGLINKGMALCEDGINVRSTYSLPARWL